MDKDTRDEGNQYLTFRLGEETFALEIGKVREVLDFTTVTRVPRVPDFMRGVINLRSSVVPVIDLRLKFGMSPTERAVSTCVIIVEVCVGEETAVLGALADSVKEVIDLEPEQIEAAPRIGAGLGTDFIRGMGRQGERFIILLDIDRVFSASEVAQSQSIVESVLEAV